VSSTLPKTDGPETDEIDAKLCRVAVLRWRGLPKEAALKAVGASQETYRVWRRLVRAGRQERYSRRTVDPFDRAS